MSERILYSGEYQHEAGPNYSVLGLASAGGANALKDHTFVGDALSVAGYEETHEVTGYPIAVYRVQIEGVEGLIYVKSDGHVPEGVDLPDQVVVYEQLTQGAYPIGQLWWRPEENFNQHFTPLETQV